MIPEAYLLGNERLKAYIGARTESGGFPGSVIISGPEGSGRHTAARLMAMSVCCTGGGDRPCFSCLFCRKILDGISPDVIVTGLRPGCKSIGVDDIRLLREDAYIAPSECSAKFYIIENSEKMTQSAQNAMLKIFEEPPKNVYFVLLCDSASSLLPTIRSRAQALSTEVFDESTLARHLRVRSDEFSVIEKKEPGRAEEIIRRAGGTLGGALTALSGETAERNAHIPEAIRALSDRKPADLLVSIKASCGSGREEACDALRALLDALRDVTVAKKRNGSTMLFYRSADEALCDGRHITARSAVRYYDRVLDALIRLEGGSANVATSVTALCAALSEIIS